MRDITAEPNLVELSTFDLGVLTDLKKVSRSSLVQSGARKCLGGALFFDGPGFAVGGLLTVSHIQDLCIGCKHSRDSHF